MARSMRSTQGVLGIVLAVVGAVLLLWGYNESQGLGNEVTEAISGSPTDEVMFLYIGGAAALAAGLFLLLKR